MALVKGHEQRIATAFVGIDAACMLNQQLAHRASSERHEVLATFQPHALGTTQLQPGFVDQRSGRQGSVCTIQLSMRTTTQFFIEQRENAVRCGCVAAAGRIDKFGKVIGHAIPAGYQFAVAKHGGAPASRQSIEAHPNWIRIFLAPFDLAQQIGIDTGQ